MGYHSYKDEFGVEISTQEAQEKIENIFSKYKKATILRLVNALILEMDSDIRYCERIVIQINSRYLGVTDRVLIHRRAVHTVSQIFYSFNNFAIENNLDITKQDLYDIFLYTNGILDFTDGGDYKTILRLFFNSTKHSSDFLNSFDLQNIFYFYIRFYTKLKSDNNFERYDKKVMGETGVSIKNIIELLDSIFSRTNKTDLGFLKENFEIDIENTFEFWNNRKPKISIPFEFKILQEKPIINSEGEKFIVCSQFFLVLALAKKIYFLLRGEDAQDFGGVFGKIVEDVIVEYLTESLSNEECKVINLKFDSSKEYADFGIIADDIVFLFEIKSGMLNLQEKYEQDVDKFKLGFDNRFVNKDGIVQQLKRINEINSDYKKFCGVTGLNENIKYKIVPIILFLDEDFFCFGFNQYLRSQYIERKTILQFKFNNINTTTLNSALILNELKSSIEILKNPKKVLYALYFYTQFSRITDIAIEPFEFFIQNYNI